MHDSIRHHQQRSSNNNNSERKTLSKTPSAGIWFLRNEEEPQEKGKWLHQLLQHVGIISVIKHALRVIRVHLHSRGAHRGDAGRRPAPRQHRVRLVLHLRVRHHNHRWGTAFTRGAVNPSLFLEREIRLLNNVRLLLLKRDDSMPLPVYLVVLNIADRWNYYLALLALNLDTASATVYRGQR